MGNHVMSGEAETEGSISPVDKTSSLQFSKYITIKVMFRPYCHSYTNY